MTLLWVYLAMTAAVVFLWFLFVGLDDLKKHRASEVAICAGIMAMVWPVLVAAVIGCVALSFLATPPKQSPR